jgi:mRNA interferase RelE/StbE
MAYQVLLTAHARKQLSRLPRKIQGRILARITSLADHPRPAQAKRLTASGHLWRVRSGDYRIVYQIEDDALIVAVVRIGHRREVYRNLPPEFR